MVLKESLHPSNRRSFLERMVEVIGLDLGVATIAEVNESFEESSLPLNGDRYYTNVMPAMLGLSVDTILYLVREELESNRSLCARCMTKEIYLRNWPLPRPQLLLGSHLAAHAPTPAARP